MRRPAPSTKVGLGNEEVPQLTTLLDGVSRWTGAQLDDLHRAARAGTLDAAQEELERRLCRTIDILGVRSQRAQEINAVLTSVARLRENKTYRLYLLTENHRGVGILKMGVKKLFVTHPSTSAMVEVDPLCVLDFYVDERCQRKGYGKTLFEHMLTAEKLSRPEVLAIDRPSSKLLGFMTRHYNLTAYTPQVNNFVVYHRFFDHTTVTERGKLLRPPSPTPTTGSAGGGGRPAAAPSSKNSRAG